MAILNRIVFILNCVAALMLLGSYFSPWVNPNFFWPVSFLGLGFSLLLTVNVIFIVYWLLQAKLWLFISLGVILFGFGHVGKFLQLMGKSDAGNSKTLKVFSFNIQNFDERYVAGNKEKSGYDDFFQYIQAEKPDILCLQEFNKYVPFGNIRSFDSLRSAFGKKNYYAYRTEDIYHLLILSRYPVVRSKVMDFVKFRSNNGAVWADIVVDKDTIRVFNVHFQSFRLNENVSMEDFDKDSDAAIKKSRNILSRLKYGFKMRAGQADSVMREIERSPYKVILTGDFNDTPMSYTYGRMRKNLKDAFVESGQGLGSTYTGPFPSFRIDYIMYSPGFDSYNYAKVGSYGSDHFLIRADVAIR